MRVVYLGRTAPGSVHDKKLADRAKLRLPKDALLEGHWLARLRTAGVRHAPAQREAKETSTTFLRKSGQLTHQPHPHRRGARRGRDQTPSHRHRHLPRLAQELGGRSHARCLWPAQSAGKLPRCCVKSPGRTNLLPQALQPHKVYHLVSPFYLKWELRSRVGAFSK